MSTHETDDVRDFDDSGLSRRDAIKRGAMIGGAALVIPVISSISMSSASASSPSGGYKPSGGTGGDQGENNDNQH
jgi:hypothetical protein